MKRVLIALIRFYQKHISSRTPPCCRFTPTCSQYAIAAIERFGAIRGTLMAMWRILKCGPWHPGGYDPVPEKKTKKRSHKKCCNHLHYDETERNEKDADLITTPTCGDNDMIDDSVEMEE